jgi:hypothetical protein
MTAKSDFSRDRRKASGHGPRCKACDRERARKRYAVHRDELYARRQSVREAERAALLKALEPEHRERVKAAKRAAEAGRRRQAKLLAEIGVEDVSGEELSRRVRAAGGHYIREGGRHSPVQSPRPQAQMHQPFAPALCPLGADW